MVSCNFSLFRHSRNLRGYFISCTLPTAHVRSKIVLLNYLSSYSVSSAHFIYFAAVLIQSSLTTWWEWGSVQISFAGHSRERIRNPDEMAAILENQLIWLKNTFSERVRNPYTYSYATFLPTVGWAQKMMNFAPCVNFCPLRLLTQGKHVDKSRPSYSLSCNWPLLHRIVAFSLCWLEASDRLTTLCSCQP